MDKLTTSQDGKSLAKFYIGSGIKAGASMRCVWDEASNNDECKQYLLACLNYK